MKIIEILNTFIKNMTSASSKKEEFVTPSLNICDMPIQHEEFSKVKGDETLDVESLPSRGKQSVGYSADTDSGDESESSEIEELTCESPSLLNNTEYMILAQQCSDMLMELDRMQSQIKNEEVLDYIVQQKSRIREALMLSGASLIADEPEFNILRHQCVNGGIVKNGTPIVETVEDGVEIAGRVMNKCLVMV